MVLIIGTMTSSISQPQNLSLELEAQGISNIENVEVYGSHAPLSWDKPLSLETTDEEGIYSINISFSSPPKRVKFKFAVDNQIELIGSDPREIRFPNEALTNRYVFNEYEKLNKDEINNIVFTEDEIHEDIQLLGEILQYIHPNIYKYRDSITFQKDIELLQNDIQSNPSLVCAYASISSFLANIKCSHTFTNPWNQSKQIEQAIFHQDDKLPFTFSRIGERIFVDRNVSEKTLKKGSEIIKINNIEVQQIMERLSKFVTSDGNNYAKKLDRITLTGNAKFELFDIFFPLVFGSHSSFDIEYKDPLAQEVKRVTINAISKTDRSMKLSNMYGESQSSLEDCWSFRVLNSELAHLKIFFNAENLPSKFTNQLCCTKQVSQRATRAVSRMQ